MKKENKLFISSFIKKNLIFIYCYVGGGGLSSI